MQYIHVKVLTMHYNAVSRLELHFGNRTWLCRVPQSIRIRDLIMCMRRRSWGQPALLAGRTLLPYRAPSVN